MRLQKTTNHKYYKKIIYKILITKIKVMQTKKKSTQNINMKKKCFFFNLYEIELEGFRGEGYGEKGDREQGRWKGEREKKKEEYHNLKITN